MPRALIERSRLARIFYPVMLALMSVVYGGLAFSWMTTITASRESGIDFMAGWFTPEVVGVMWLAAAISALLCAIISYRSRRACPMEIGLSAVVIGVPLLLALVFFFSTFGVILDPSLVPASHAWVTGVSYIGYAGVAAWSYLVYMSLPKASIEE